jgi:hypothetical protein
MSRILGVTFAACAAIGLARAASAQQYYGPESLEPPAPPPAVAEENYPAPPERPYWVRGHYEWNGVEYVWVRGHYIEQPAGLYWDPGRWVWQYDRLVRTGGHWRR